MRDHRYHEHSNISEEERRWRSKQRDNINYKDYLKYFPSRTAKLMKTKIPAAIHSFLPPKIVAKAIETSLKKADRSEMSYSTTRHDGGNLIMTAKIHTTASLNIISVLRYEKDERETVILVLADDTAELLANIEDILDSVRDNLRNTLNGRKTYRDENGRTVIDVNWDE